MSNWIRKFKIMTLLILFLVGCAHWQTTADAWKGKPIDELIYRWGPPASMYELGDGRKTATFKHSRVYQASTYYCIVTFNTDTNGVIQSSTIDGNIGGCNPFFTIKKAPTAYDTQK